MKNKWMLGFSFCILCLCFYMFHIIYNEAKAKAIEELTFRQMIHANQAKKGIEGFFRTTIKFLHSISESEHIADLDTQGKNEMAFALTLEPDTIKAITRVDASGRILYTVPYNKGVIGEDISSQKHMQEILETHKPVVSDVFDAVQGYRAVALHVPVFDEKKFKGTMAVLIDFLSISRQFLEGIRLGETGYAWMTSREGVELYCPVPGHIGNSVFENCKNFPTILTMAEKMVAGNKGTSTYFFDRIRDQKKEIIKKHAVYLPIQVVDNFWTIVIASSEKDVLSSLVSIKNKLIIVLGLLLVCLGVFSFYSTIAVGIIREAAQRKKAEEALRESEKKYRLIVENQSDLVVQVDLEGKFLFVSPSYCQLFGKTEQEILNTNFMPLVHDDDQESTAREMEKLYHPPYTAYMEQRAMTKDGWRWISWQDTALLDENEKIVAIIGVGRDITERKRTRELIIQSEKMISLGGLAAGMAHEINNPLAGMMQSADVIRNRLTNLDLPSNKDAAKRADVSMEAVNDFMIQRDIPKMLDNIKKSGGRAAEIIENMLGFARKSEGKISLHRISDLLDNALNLATTDYDLKNRYDFKLIRIRKKYAKKLPKLLCDGNEIQQVFLNILFNAAQAMKSAETQHPQILIRARLEKAHKILRIEIEDNGPGMDEKIQQRIFEPFFTTKPVGFGTGLGLSVSYYIVTEIHRGKLEVKSLPDKGSTFVVRLPLDKSDSC